MKIKFRILIIMFICTLLFTLCSCKKVNNLEYKYVGAYVEILDVEQKTMEDRNLKLYYDFYRQSLINNNRIYEYQISTSSLTKDVKNNLIDLSATYTISVANKSQLQEVNVYPIVYDGTNYKILEEKKTIKLKENETKGVSFRTSYFFDDEEYSFKVSIKIYKKETL